MHDDDPEPLDAGSAATVSISLMGAMTTIPFELRDLPLSR